MEHLKICACDTNREKNMHQCIEDIYFFWLNTKYIPSSEVKINLYFSRVCSTSENADIFTEPD